MSNEQTHPLHTLEEYYRSLTNKKPEDRLH